MIEQASDAASREVCRAHGAFPAISEKEVEFLLLAFQKLGILDKTLDLQAKG
jgi:hypothetical protein